MNELIKQTNGHYDHSFYEPDRVYFHGQSLFVLERDGKRWVAMKPICEAIGIDWESQRKRLQRDAVLSRRTVIMTVRLPGDPRTREVNFLELEYLNGWLFGIDANRVRPEIRARVIEHQDECYKVLAGHFNRTAARLADDYRRKAEIAEARYFLRYPTNRLIRAKAMSGEPYWYIANLAGCAPSTVGKAVVRMIHWGLIDARLLKSARTGCGKLWALRRKFHNQLDFGF